MATSKRFPIAPAHPERVCWGCDRYCSADDMRCGNGSDRTQHPAELFGDDWMSWGQDAVASEDATCNDKAPVMAPDSVRR
ncbi:MAG: DUF3079 domain-containing protein [Rhodoferax sp.]